MALPNNFTDISFKNLIARFLRLNIAMKMLVGYLPLAILLGIISVYSLSSLERLNHLSTSILKIDIPIAKSADGMIDDILAQELYARRHLILKSKNMKEIFAERGIDFQAKLDSIKLLPNAEKLPILTIETLHNEYETLFKKRFKYIKRPGSKTARNLDKQIEEKQLEITSLVKELNARSVEDQQRRTLLSAAVGDTAFKVAAVLCLLGFILGVGAAIIVSRSISSSVKKLKIATHMISEGNFSDLPEITNQDELGDLSQSFIEMGRRLSRLEEMYIDASPLTRLPGNIAIENVLKKRVESNSLTAFCLCDIDNFKSYNDSYGYAKGNEVILLTARCLTEAVEENGGEDDFVGHIGGDDFAVITTPDRAPYICDAILKKFDEAIPKLYSEQDRARGYIAGFTRQGDEIDFPLASLSIAVITNTKRRFESHLQVGELAAELKEHAKAQKGSVYITDLRKVDSSRPHIH